MTEVPRPKLRIVAAFVVLIAIAAFLFWQVFLGLTTSRWDVAILTFLAFALWIAIYVVLSAHEDSA